MREIGEYLSEFGIICESCLHKRIGHLSEDGDDLWGDIFEDRIDDEPEIIDRHVGRIDAADERDEEDAECVDVAFGAWVSGDLFRWHIAECACDSGAAALDLRVCDGAEVDEGDIVSVLGEGEYEV